MNCGSSKNAKLQLFDAKSNLFARMNWIRQAIFASKIEVNVGFDENVLLTQNSKHQFWSDILFLMLIAFFNRGCEYKKTNNQSEK